ncbi:MAG: hypothetical protein JWO82_1299 [Akkermansiaceae bacterium]|nr:hypothetical protein [Akkermansiaceae bacterium]
MKPNHLTRMVVAIILGAVLIVTAVIFWPRHPREQAAIHPTPAEVEEIVRTELAKTLLLVQQSASKRPPTPDELAFKERTTGMPADQALALILPDPENPGPLPATKRARIILPEVARTHPADAVHWYRDHWESFPDLDRKDLKTAVIGAIAKNGSPAAAISAMEELERKSSPEGWQAIALNAPDADSWTQTFDRFQDALAARPPYDHSLFLEKVLPAFAESLRQLPFATAAPCLERLESGGEPFAPVLRLLDEPANAAETGDWLSYLQRTHPALFNQKAPAFVDRWIGRSGQFDAAKVWIDRLPPGDLQNQCINHWITRKPPGDLQEALLKAMELPGAEPPEIQPR